LEGPQVLVCRQLTCINDPYFRLASIQKSAYDNCTSLSLLRPGGLVTSNRHNVPCMGHTSYHVCCQTCKSSERCQKSDHLHSSPFVAQSFKTCLSRQLTPSRVWTFAIGTIERGRRPILLYIQAELALLQGQFRLRRVNGPFKTSDVCIRSRLQSRHVALPDCFPGENNANKAGSRSYPVSDLEPTGRYRIAG
jgi:hypothetical protein